MADRILSCNFLPASPIRYPEGHRITFPRTVKRIYSDHRTFLPNKNAITSSQTQQDRNVLHLPSIVKKALFSSLSAALLTFLPLNTTLSSPTSESGFWQPWNGSAMAAGLLRMPPESLVNSYWLVRAGESEWEAYGTLKTNPVLKTNVENGLSDSGKKQSLKSALKLKKEGACFSSCWLWPSITQRSYQTAEIIAYVNGLSYNRIVPEYSFLDARGLGAFEGQPLAAIEEVYRADEESTKIRPPSFTDGTPNESVSDVLVRVTQLMSILETQYSGETIVIISPDSDNLSVLQAALTGLDLRKHSSLSFSPGEIRLVELSVNPPPPLISGYVSLQ